MIYSGHFVSLWNRGQLVRVALYCESTSPEGARTYYQCARSDRGYDDHIEVTRFDNGTLFGHAQRDFIDAPFNIIKSKFAVCHKFDGFAGLIASFADSAPFSAACRDEVVALLREFGVQRCGVDAAAFDTGEIFLNPIDRFLASLPATA